MKQCPQCKTSYTDDSLRFCLADGAVLTDGADVQPPGSVETAVFPAAERERVRIETPETVTIASERRPASAPQRKDSGGRAMKWIAGLIAAGLFLLVLISAAALIFYFGLRNDSVITGNKPPAPTPASTPATNRTSTTANSNSNIDDEAERLRRQIAELQEKLNADKTSENVPDLEGFARARVNSPGDGFLAMRSEPSVDRGIRVTKIPHNTLVTLENCEPDQMTIGDKKGRWCYVTYGEESGWVFDAFLTY